MKTKIEINKIYAFTLEGLKNGKELELIAEDKLTLKGIANVYEQSKKLWHSKDKNNYIRKSYIFGIDDKGNFYERRPDQINFEDKKMRFAKITLENPCKKEYLIEDIEHLDRIYNLGLVSLYNKLVETKKNEK